MNHADQGWEADRRFPPGPLRVHTATPVMVAELSLGCETMTLVWPLKKSVRSCLRKNKYISPGNADLCG